MNTIESNNSTDKFKVRDNNELSNYIEMFKDDVKLDMHNLREKSLMASSIWAKWLSYLFHEKENLDRIAVAKQKIMKSKMNDVKANDSVLRMKSQDKILENDDTMKKLNQLQKKTQDNIDFIERSLIILQNFGFQIKNTLDYIKLQSN